mmetsp:Transcript_24357/g.28212  ORF Transcript_24357/g.28212 Transcript_24357/m.28212 type:complete len:100 (+) Transcript_24357:1-300(+)
MIGSVDTEIEINLANYNNTNEFNPNVDSELGLERVRASVGLLDHQSDDLGESTFYQRDPPLVTIEINEESRPYDEPYDSNDDENDFDSLTFSKSSSGEL